MKNILLLVHDDAGQEGRLQVALDVTRTMDGHLTCLDVTQVPMLIGDGYSGAATAMLLAEEREREAANKARLEIRLAAEDVSWDWIDMTGDLAACITSAATLADVIVVNRRLDDFPVPDMRGLVRELVLKSGKPILAVPQDATGLDLSGRALVAWDGSSTAQAALQAAVPLLARAGAVVLFEAEESATKMPAEEAAAYLSRHDIHATITRRPAGGNASEVVLSEARHGHFSYVVLGGFGHSLLRDTLFGSVARTLLTKSPIPLFIGH